MMRLQSVISVWASILPFRLRLKALRFRRALAKYAGKGRRKSDTPLEDLRTW
jgi:hypothetical protein